MKYSEITFFLSKPRMQRFLDSTGSKTKAVRLYKANLRIAQSIHPLLGILEVILRNRLNQILATHFVDKDWITNQINGFMSDPALIFKHKRTGQIRTNNFLKKEIEKAQKRIKKSGAVVTNGKVIAEQTMGFWTNLFEVHHYKLLSGKPIKIFNNLPPGYGRKEILNDLNTIRRLRNRINHNEPICFNGAVVDFTPIENIYTSIVNILRWIDPQLEDWISDIDTVQNKIINAKKI